jgi:hypothetical protein
MAFNITPAEYFKMLVEQHAEYTGDPLSLRKAIAVSMFANHLCEHIFAAYSGVDSAKLDGSATPDIYRSNLEAQKPELRLIRDLCDYGKHGPSLKRKTVQVSQTEVKETMVPDFTGLLLGLTNHFAADKIVVTLSDGSERFFDYLIDDVVRFWNTTFVTKAL